MQCQLCGVVLQPGARACASCGTSTSPDHSDDSSYEYGTSPIPYIPYATPVKTSSEASDHSSPPDPSLDVVAHPSTTQPQRNRLSAVLVVVSVILVVFLGIGGGFVYYTLAIRPAQQQSQLSVGTSTIQQPSNNQNAASTITATNPQDLYTQATSGTPLNLQNSLGWQAVESSNCTFTGNSLHATAPATTSTNTNTFCLYRSTSFVNFAYQSRVTIKQGDLFALIFRFNTLGPVLYMFGMSPEGIYELMSGQSNSTSQMGGKILAGGTSSAINTGLNQSNLLTVIVRGNTIYLYINQQYLTSVNDDVSSIGQIGVAGTNTRGGPVDVTFSELQLWKL